MWFPETRAWWRTQMYIKHSSLCVNKGKDFLAPPDRERLDQIVRLTSNLHQKQNMAPKIDSDVQQVGELLIKAASHAAHIHDSLSNSALFHHSRAKRETASAKRLTSKRQRSRNYFHKAHHRQVQRNNLRIFMTHLHWHYAWWIHRLLNPVVGRDLDQVFKRHWCEGVLWLPGPPSRSQLTAILQQ